MNDLLCTSCHQPITGKYIKTMGKCWHPDCFRCAFCGEPIQKSGFLVKAGKPYHSECYQKKFAPRCAMCGEPVAGNYVRAFRKYWHPQHFVCARCGKPIDGKFYAHDGKPYCESDYRALFAVKCSRCGAVLTGRYSVDIWGNKYCSAHSREPRCSSCSRFIGTEEAPKGFKYSDGRIICSVCHKTAVSRETDVALLVEDIQKVLAKHQFHFDKKNRLPIILTGRKELHLALQKRSRQLNTAGVTQTQIHTFMGVERSREVLSIQVLFGLPYEHMGSVLAHELGHAWLFLNHFPQLPRQIEEGICEWMASLWLKTRNTKEAEFRLLLLEKNPSRIYGTGYRAFVKAVERKSPAYVLAYVKRYGRLPGK